MATTREEMTQPKQQGQRMPKKKEQTWLTSEEVDDAMFKGRMVKGRLNK
jgi:hypothetical protein